jgi:hypothetical protein
MDDSEFTPFVGKSKNPHSPQNFSDFLACADLVAAFAAIGFGQNAFLSLFILVSFIVLAKVFFQGPNADLLLYKPQLLLGIGLFQLLDLRKAGERWGFSYRVVSLSVSYFSFEATAVLYLYPKNCG